jgi:phage shock protein E
MKSLLVLMVAVLFCGTAAAADQTSPKPTGKPVVRNVKVEAFDELRRTEKDVVLLDVRTREEYQKGHIPGAILIDFMADDFAQQIAKLDKSKTYLVHCASGGRSARACRKMADADFSRMYNLEGGMAAWEKAGKPVEK